MPLTRRLPAATTQRLGLVLLGSLLCTPPAAGQELTFRHFAGNPGGPGAIDGPAADARLYWPGGVAVDASGNVFFTDVENGTVRRLSPSGVVSTLAGLAGVRGSADGRGSSAQFNGPRGVAVDGAGNVYVADEYNHTVRKVTPAGVVTTLAGKAQMDGRADGVGAEARFSQPAGLSTDRDGNILVADSGNNAVRRVTPEGVVSTLTIFNGASAPFYGATGVTVDALGNVYASEGIRHTISKLTPDGVLSIYAGRPGLAGTGDGQALYAYFYEPMDVRVDAAGNVWVADGGNATIRKVSPDGWVTTVAGVARSPGSEDGTGATARFVAPRGFALDGAGNLVIADAGSFALRRMTPSGVVTTVAGRARRAGSADGPAVEALFRAPAGVAFDALGNAYLADADNATIRKVDPSGLVSTFAGSPGLTGSADGTGAAARFLGPLGLAVDAGGNVLVIDGAAKTIRRITPGGVVTTLAGLAGAGGHADGSGSAARFEMPRGIAVDAAGNAFVADDLDHTIRKVTPEGIVTTLAGSPGYAGSEDGTGAVARFRNPAGVATGPDGAVWVTDSGNQTIRRVSPGGVVTTVAGIPGRPGDADGAGSAARFRYPAEITADGTGGFLVVDGAGRRIRRLTAAGDVTTVAGRVQANPGHFPWFSEGIAEEGTGRGARFSRIGGLAVGPGERVLVSDSGDDSLWTGTPTLPDAARIDASQGPVGAARQLDAVPATAGTWRWEAVRIEGSSSAALSSPASSSTAFTPDVEGLYVFRLTASDAATARISTVALAAGSVLPTAAVSGSTSLCLGSQAEVRADLTGTSPWDLTWSDGVLQAGIATSPATRIVSPSASTTWSVASVTNAHGAGSASGAGFVDVLPVPTATVSGSRSICPGAGASVWVQVTGTPPIEITWSDGFEQTFGFAGSFARAVNPAETTTYSVDSVVAAGCPGSASGSATVTLLPVPTATVAGSTIVCAGQRAELTADLTGTGPWKVVWSDGWVDDAVAASPSRHTVSPGSTTTYTVTRVRDSVCEGPGTGSATVTVAAGGPPDVAILVAGPVAPGATGVPASVADAGPGASYAWTVTNGELTSGQGTPSITFSLGGVVPCVLSVTVSRAGGCASTGATLVRAGTDPAPPLYTSHLSGAAGGAGWFDGPPGTARFQGPTGIAIDPSGRVVVADASNHTLRTLAPDGTTATLAGVAGVLGSADGTRSGAQFDSPEGVAADADGNVYVADTYNHVIRRVSPAGVVSTLAGAPGVEGSADGPGPQARFFLPVGLTADGSGNVYVADYENGTIRKVTPAGFVSTIAGAAGSPGSQDGTGTGARFDHPVGIASGVDGVLWVADQWNHTIRRVTPAGVVTTVAGQAHAPGSLDGTGSGARFRFPFGVAVDAAGVAWVTDAGNHTIRQVTASGVVTTLAGSAGIPGTEDGDGAAARFRYPNGIAVDASGEALVSDWGNHSIRRVSGAGVVSTVAGQAPDRRVFDGDAAEARFLSPGGVALDAAGTAFVTEPSAHVVRMIAPDGVVTTLAGLAGTWGAANGTGPEARFHSPAGVACDVEGNLVVADRENHTIRRVSPAGLVTTIAGLPGSPGQTDGSGTAARFDDPSGVAVDAVGNVYVADRDNHAIRTIAPDGLVRTFAGAPGVRGRSDGPPAHARFSAPRGVAVDARGNVVVADTENATIRRITPDGFVTTLAGQAGSPGAEDGTGPAARFSAPVALAADVAGNVWVADASGHTLRRVSPGGVVTTLSGSPMLAGSADGTGAAAQHDGPFGVACGLAGELVVADGNNGAIRRGVASLPDAATIDAPVGEVGVARRLASSPRTASSWLWEEVRREAGSNAALSSMTAAEPSFTPDAPGLYRFRLTASDGIRTSATIVSLAVGLPAPTATLVGTSREICVGGYADLEARLTGTPPWEVTWSDGYRHAAWTTASATRRVTPAVTTTYSIAAVSDATGPGVASGTVEVGVVGPPARPVLTAPAVVSADSPGRFASVEAHPGSTYSWRIQNGYIYAGQGTNRVEFVASFAGILELAVVEANAAGCPSEEAAATVTVLPFGTSTLFYPVAPCRVFDSRDANGPSLGQPIPAGEVTWVAFGERCDVPTTASAVAVNVTVVQPTAAGSLALYPALEPRPEARLVYFAAGRLRSVSALLKVSPTGAEIAVLNDSTGPVHVVFDVGGYFE